MGSQEVGYINGSTDIQVQVSSLAKQIAMVSRNLITYDTSSPVFQTSFQRLYSELTDFLEKNGYLTFIVKESALLFNGIPVYRADLTPNSLPFVLYKDGIRMLTFSEGLEKRDLMKFISALKEVRKTDPYESDLVTILWEKDLSHISYKAVDTYIVDQELQNIDLEPISQPEEGPEIGLYLSDEFLENELGIIRKPQKKSRPSIPTEEQILNMTREILEEDLCSLAQRASTICIDILGTSTDEEILNTMASAITRMCNALVSNGNFIEACAVLSDLRGLLIEASLPIQRKSIIMDIIDTLGKPENISPIISFMNIASESKSEEACAYLSMLNPNVLPHLCKQLGECQKRSTRYLLCRILSVIGKDQPEDFDPFLSDPRWYLVRNIAMILGMTANPKALPLLRKLIHHCEPRVRKEVARSVGRIRSAEGIAVLKSLVEDQDKTVRLVALTSLRQVASPAALPILKAKIADKRFSKLSEDEKVEIIRTLSSLGNAGLEVLTEIALQKHKHIDERLAVQAVQSIISVESENKKTILKKIQSQCKEAVAAAAGQALKTIESRGVHVA